MHSITIPIYNYIQKLHRNIFTNQLSVQTVQIIILADPFKLHHIRNLRNAAFRYINRSSDASL